MTAERGTDKERARETKRAERESERKRSRKKEVERKRLPQERFVSYSLLLSCKNLKTDISFFPENIASRVADMSRHFSKKF